MRWILWLFCVGADVVLAAWMPPVFAQPAPPPDGSVRLVTLQPAEVDTIAVAFRSWTLTGAGSVTVTCLAPCPGGDADPSGIIASGPSLADNKISVRLAPGSGRNGRSYQITLAPAAGSDTPIADFRVDVKKVNFR